MGLLAWIIVGLIAGWLAGLVMKGGGYGVLGDIILGIIGAIIGGARPRFRRALRRFGHHLGRAFQLQDDLLDVVAEEKEFGKTIGGDIAEGKRTYLLLTALDRATGADRELLLGVLRKGARGAGGPDTATITAVREVYDRTGALRDARSLVERNTRSALRALQQLPRNAGNYGAWP